MKEKWKDVKGFEDFYKVSNTGRVIRKERFAKWKDKDSYTRIPEKELEPAYDKDGYLKTAFRVNGKRYYKRIHVIVIEAFIPNVNNLPVVNHKNGIKDDNRVENLEWMTISQNTKHGFTDLGRSGHNGNMNKPIYKMDKSGVIIKKYNSIKEASLDVGVKQTAITQSMNRKNGTCGGFTWKLCNEDATTIENNIEIL